MKNRSTLILAALLAPGLILAGIFPSDLDLSPPGRVKVASWPKRRITLGYKEFVSAIYRFQTGSSSDALMNEIRENLPHHRQALTKALLGKQNRSADEGAFWIFWVGEFPHPDSISSMFALMKSNTTLSANAVGAVSKLSTWISWRKFTPSQVARLKQLSLSKDKVVSEYASKALKNLQLQKARETRPR